MKVYQNLLPFVALASAFVIPDDAVMNQVTLESNNQDIFDKYATPQDFVKDAKCKFSNAIEASHDALDNAVHSVKETFDDATAQLEESVEDEIVAEDHGHHPHEPHKGHPHHKMNLTVYELISKSKYTTKLAKLINEFDDVVELLNSTKDSFTVFAPTDKAFEKILEHGHKPSKEILLKVLSYHVAPGFFPAGRVFGSHTIPTLLEGTELSEDPKTTPQRLTIKPGWTGLYIDGFSKVVYPNVFGTNGVVHAVDHILVPPPSVGTIIEFSPTAFSTFNLALQKAEFGDVPHKGGTLFAPPNGAWKKLGFKINAFLFSKYGKKYLKAILEYHMVANQTLYSDAFYGVDEDISATTFPKGVYHLDLPTLLEGKSVGVDIARYGRFIEMKVNAFTRVAYQDVIARDGVLQIVNNVILPPKKVGGEEVHYNGEELTVEDLKERLDPYVDHDEDDSSDDSLEL